MIGNQAHPLPVEHVGSAHLCEFMNRQRRGDVIAQHEIEAAIDEFPRVHFGFPGMRGEYFFGDSHRHGLISPKLVTLRRQDGDTPPDRLKL